MLACENSENRKNKNKSICTSPLPHLLSTLTVDVCSRSCAVIDDNIDTECFNHPSVQAGIRLMGSFGCSPVSASLFLVPIRIWGFK